MQTRLSIHASFGPNCPASKDAKEYLERVIATFEDVQFASKIMRRTKHRECIVQFYVLVDESLDRDAAEELVDRLHYQALGGYGYENMHILEDGVEQVGTAD